jgi:diguanylate cyclase (GGDEF)-like protein
MIFKQNEVSQQGMAASHARTDWTRNGQMRTHYVAYWSEDKVTMLCGHQHDSVAKAVECIQSADGSVKAFTDGQERPLTSSEMQGMVGALLELYGRAKKFAREDPFISGILIRRGFMEVLEQERTRCCRCTQPLTMVFLDLDDFKSVNVTLGKDGGQLVLKVMAWTMQRARSKSDSVARLEEDRFALLLPETDADTTRVVLGKLREDLRDVLKTYQWDVTFSVMAVTFQNPPESSNQMIDVAERHMGSAKSQGKDRISYLTAD